jgi:hypothetical protein
MSSGEKRVDNEPAHSTPFYAESSLKVQNSLLCYVVLPNSVISGFWAASKLSPEPNIYKDVKFNKCICLTIVRKILK